jgi:hypothetical protein
MTVPENTPVPQPIGLFKSVLLGLLILAAGIAIGSGLTYMSLSRPQDRYGQEPEIFAEHMLSRLGQDLNLTPQQRQQLDPVIRTHYKTLSDIRAGVRPQVVAQLEEMDRQIVSVLDEDQKLLWQQKIQRLEQHFPTFRGPGRGPGPGQGFGPEPGRGGPGQGFGPDSGRGPGIGPGLPLEPGQDFPSGPRGPRQSFGPGNRRQDRFGPPTAFDPNDANMPLPPLPPPSPLDI